MYLSLMLTAEDHTQCWGDTPSPLGHISSWEEPTEERRRRAREEGKGWEDLLVCLRSALWCFLLYYSSMVTARFKKKTFFFPFNVTMSLLWNNRKWLKKNLIFRSQTFWNTADNSKWKVQKHKKDLKIYTYKELATAFFCFYLLWQLTIKSWLYQ